jgi:3-keto-5-aminohexanoate cleavage enzyme
VRRLNDYLLNISGGDIMAKIDFSKYKDVPTIGFQPFGKIVMDLSDHLPWEIPSEVAIIAAPTGAFFTKQQNPSQPYSADETIKEAIECVEAGACSVHVHVRDENGFPSGDRRQTEKVVKALRARFGGNVHIDGEALFGKNFEEMMEPIVLDFYESAAVNCHATFMGDTLSFLPPQSCKATVEVLQAYGKIPLLSIYNPGDIDDTYRWLIKPGLVKRPFNWSICSGMPGGAPMWDPLSMAETLLYLVRRIKDVDEAKHPNIIVCTTGRASSYLSTLAILLGFNVRVGKEDTIYKKPHTNDLITSNKEIVEETVAIARLAGREPMTAAEYRKVTGMKPLS